LNLSNSKDFLRTHQVLNPRKNPDRNGHPRDSSTRPLFLLIFLEIKGKQKVRGTAGVPLKSRLQPMESTIGANSVDTFHRGGPPTLSGAFEVSAFSSGG
jgi:hypothetical protein